MIKIRFQKLVLGERLSFSCEMPACPRIDDTVYLEKASIRGTYIVTNVIWTPDDRIQHVLVTLK